jgi:hypothetical protein
MAVYAQGSRSSLAIGEETSFGQEASSFTKVPIKTHSLNLSKEPLKGSDIQEDRMPRVSRHGTRSAAGSIEVDLRKGNYDALLESALLGAFDSADELVVGTEPKFFTIEDAMNDAGVYRLFTGMTVSSMGINITPTGQLVETTFEMVGKDMVTNNSAKTATAAQKNDPFGPHDGEMYEGGIGTGDLINIVSSINFTVTNSFAPAYAVGQRTAPHLEFGRSIIEGTMSVYVEDDALINKFLDEVESAIQVSVDDASQSNPYTFFMPRVKFNGANVPLADPQSRIIELPFEALYDTGEATQLRITRTS